MNAATSIRSGRSCISFSQAGRRFRALMRTWSCNKFSQSNRLGRARRHRTLVTSATVAVFLLIVGAVAGLAFWQQAEHDRQTAKQQADEESQKAKQQAEQEIRDHRFALRSAAEADKAIALTALRADRFAGAEAVLRKAAGTLDGEPELAALRAELEG